MTSTDGLVADRSRARALDAADPLAPFRRQFHIPTRADGREEIYFCGDSLGLQPTRTEAYVREELRTWRERGVRGHHETEWPWLPYHERLGNAMAIFVGVR